MVKQQERKAATRTAIIAAALDAFGQRGYATVTVDQIAEQAGVAKGALYHHFASKDVLFEAVLESVSAVILTEVIAATGQSGDFRKALASGNRAFFIACADPVKFRILLQDGPGVLGWVRWRRIDQRNFGGLLKMAIVTGIEQGVIAGRNPDVIVHTLLGAITEAAISAAESEDFMACAEQYLETIDAMIGGLAVEYANTDETHHPLAM
jgi:AcrR family transcriptional regulator